MRIGIPRETKLLEGRVGLIPAACAELVREGHAVHVERDAGVASGYRDADYERAGARVLQDAAAVYGDSQLIVKVKEPTADDLQHLRGDHQLFCYLHLAADPGLARRLLTIGLTAVAFETVEANGHLPLLAPMSDIAGRLAVQIGAHLLEAPQGGKGVLLGGLPGAERGHVVIVGGGVAGNAATEVAAALGARVTVFDPSRNKLERARALGPNVTGLHPFGDAVAEATAEADLLIGAVLVTGRRAPHVVSADAVRRMGPGSVVMDISVDQGGCIETTRPTTYAEPTFQWEGVTHFGVTNIPGAVPRSGSQALSAAVTPYVLRLAAGRLDEDPALARGLNLRRGEIVHPAVAEEIGR